MSCYHPQTVYRRVPGPGVSFSEIPGKTGSSIEIPCGYCIGCKLERARQWSVRIMHEAQLHERNSFLTLTYSDEYLPEDFGLHHEHVQVFLKRLRKKCSQDLRYYVCGEYGDRTSRPHYHMCLFGEDFYDDRTLYSVNNGNRLYSSNFLDGLWRLGDCQIGQLTVQSASYVARYVVNKQYKDDYECVDQATGEVMSRRPPYCAMSLRPAIGRRWIEKYFSEVYGNDNDSCYADGRIHRPPRYYDKVYEDQLGKNLDNIRKKRLDISDKRCDDNTTDRLMVRERVKKAQISKLRRSYHE